MGKLSGKPVIGILGGMCSGKSTVAAEFARYGCAVIDADKIAHDLLEQQDVKKKVVGCFGKGVLDTQGGIDRKKLADIVFADRGKLSRLNKVIHPLVLEQAERLIEQFNAQEQVRAIVLDMPLLLEVGWEKRCKKLVFVDCNGKIRLERAREMGVFNENQLKVRENFQISLDKKAAVADNTVDNNSDLAVLSKQVAEIFTKLVNNG
jgi:dephospho-CoA kinase